MSSIVNKLFRMDGRVVVVNGGAGRIGKQFCLVLADAGAKVVLLDLDGARASEVAAEVCHSSGGTVLAIETDSTKKESLEEALEKTVAEFGTAPSGLVNSTQFRGTGFYGSDPADHPIEAWDQVFAVNVSGVLLSCQVFGKAMFESGGSIVNVSSTYGIVSADPRIYGDSGVNSPISYAGSKSAILNMTRYLAVHWREKNIRVNTLVPGGVFDNQGEEFVKNYSARTPLGRMANADEYQGAILFMLSSASSYMTGATVTVDGGWTAW